MDSGKQSGIGTVKLIIIVAILVLVLVAAGTAAALYITGAFSGDDATGVAQESEPALGAPVYLEIEPAITVNVSEGNRRAILQARVQIMARDEGALEGVRDHMPVVRNNLIMLFSDQDYEAIGSREGKESLREEALAEINAILEDERLPGRVEAVYFTSFVMQ